MDNNTISLYTKLNIIKVQIGKIQKIFETNLEKSVKCNFFLEKKLMCQGMGQFYPIF